MLIDLIHFQRDILYSIAGLDTPYGLAIKEDLEEYYGVEVNYGRLYPNLDDLADKDYIDKGSIDDRTNSYVLTDQAKQAIEARRTWENQRVEGSIL